MFKGKRALLLLFDLAKLGAVPPAVGYPWDMRGTPVRQNAVIFDLAEKVNFGDGIYNIMPILSRVDFIPPL